jgi:large conductance mechanosensitive channel
MGVVKEFRTFALKGNVIHLAIGVIIGGAFGKIVNSLVADILMPPLGLLIGDLDFREFKLFLGAPDSGSPVFLKYGSFIQVCFEFLIVSIFFAMKLFNTAHEKETRKTETEKDILADIRSILRNDKLSS